MAQLEIFSEQCAIFNPVSWETHFIPLAAAEVLKLLAAGPLDFENLAESFGIEARSERDSEEFLRLSDILSGLRQKGLVSNESAADGGWFDCAFVGPKDDRGRPNG